MELCQTEKFVCNYCNKGYPCGNSLGDHLRSHSVVNLVDGDDEKNKQIENCDRKLEIGAEFSGEEQYEFVENEKVAKTWVISDSGTSKLLKICKECGKVFQSVKALCGHMACHSEKDKQKEIMYGGSDTESSGPMQQRRSRRLRCRTLDIHSSSVSMANARSSPYSKIEQEQEEVALCLLMLSRDIGYRGGVNSNVESPDNNSAKSSSDINFDIDNSELKKTNKPSDGKSLNFGIDLSDDSDAEYFESGIYKTKRDVSDNVLTRNYQIGLTGQQNGSEFQDFNAQWINGCKELGTTKSSLVKDCMDDESEINYRVSAKDGTTRDGKNDFGRPGVTDGFYKKIKNGNSLDAEVHTDDCYESMNTRTKNTVGAQNCAVKSPGSKLIKTGVKKSRKNKGHKCPFCPKIFRSGQALGGHKRIHFLSGSGDRTFVVNQQTSSLLDLNFPPIEEMNGNSSLMPW